MEAGICDCGFHESLTSDLENHFTFDVKVCNVCKGWDQYRRVQAEDDERIVKALGEKPAGVTPRPMDGRKTVPRMKTAAEVEASRARRPGRRRR
jgi:hypothetical protein